MQWPWPAMAMALAAVAPLAAVALRTAPVLPAEISNPDAQALTPTRPVTTWNLKTFKIQRPENPNLNIPGGGVAMAMANNCMMLQRVVVTGMCCGGTRGGVATNALEVAASSGQGNEVTWER